MKIEARTASMKARVSLILSTSISAKTDLTNPHPPLMPLLLLLYHI
jgi:hypothetical protein